MDKKDFISASELGDFVFCKRGWWLRMQGLLPVTYQMVEGNREHNGLFTNLIRLLLLEKITRVLIILGILLLALIFAIFLLS